MNILIADDSEILRQRLVTMLSEITKIEYIWQAEDISQTIKLASSLTPDLIILDIHFPDGSGLEVLKNIKLNYPKIKVIMLTNFSFPQYRSECKKIGADYFLDKASEFNQVTDIINSIK